MNPTISALLDLQAIDRRRLRLRTAREALAAKLTAAQKAAAAEAALAEAAAAEVAKAEALVRQYQADSARCDATIAELRAQQPSAKTNKDYMALINAIEQAKSEKAMRDSSIKELGGKVDVLKERASKAEAKSAEARTAAGAAAAAAAAAAQPSPEEAEAQAAYDAMRAGVDPEFLTAYERLAKAGKPPLMRVDPTTRATEAGILLSHNQLEQIRLGKLVIDRGSSRILYIASADGAGQRKSTV